MILQAVALQTFPYIVSPYEMFFQNQLHPLFHPFSFTPKGSFFLRKGVLLFLSGSALIFWLTPLAIIFYIDTNKI
jgi:hypothetical protein